MFNKHNHLNKMKLIKYKIVSRFGMIPGSCPIKYSYMYVLLKANSFFFSGLIN